MPAAYRSCAIARGVAKANLCHAQQVHAVLEQLCPVFMGP